MKTLLILGDLTDAKDEHNAELVNRVVREIDALRKIVPRIVILMGNHDFLRQGHMYFDFLRALDGVEVITEPSEDKDVKGALTFFLPYSKDPVKDWAGFDFSHYQYLFLHQTVKGARSSNGQEMEGEALPPLNAAKVYSGDIHVPQVIGGVEYIGSPYHVHMGDNFKPRCVLLERDGRPIDLHFKTISRISMQVADLDELAHRLSVETKVGDHVKIRMALSASDRHDWRRIKREAAEMATAGGLLMHGLELIASQETAVRALAIARGAAITPDRAVLNFVTHEELGGDAFDAAMNILENQ